MILVDEFQKAHQRNYLVTLFSFLLAFMPSYSGWSQEDVYLGEAEYPLMTDSIFPMQNYGVLGDFSGGYDVGEFAANFTVYDNDGESLTLYDELSEDKPVIICSGSVTCERFTDMWDLWGADQGTLMAHQYVAQNAEAFNWIFMYNVEAHPADLENCTSNCPAVAIPAPNGEFVWQHQTYGDRHSAHHLWMEILDSPLFTYSMYHPMYCDNPNNGVYDNFFARPFGVVVLGCDGEVLARGDWLDEWLVVEGGMNMLDSLLMESYQDDCLPPPECDEFSTDTDGDGICDMLEEYDGTDAFDPCDPVDTDTDGDGYCDLLEENSGWDLEDPCDPEQGEACELCPDGALDSDDDGICDDQENFDGTDPNDPCSPNDYDADLDGLCDMEEELNGSDPNDPCDPDDTDTDGDGYCDIEELLNGTDPDDINDPDPQTSIDELDGNGLSVYPNPVSETLNVRHVEAVQQWVVYDMFGRSVKQGSPLDIQFDIDCTDLGPGSYLLMIRTLSGQSTRRIIRN